MPLLSLKNVSKSFGSLVVTDDVSFDVPEGQALGIIGPNGAGKSTLFNLITGNLGADAGTIAFDGRDVTRVPAMRRCLDGIGRSFQIPQPFGKLTVFENLVVAATHGRAAPETEVTGICADILERTGLICRKPTRWPAPCRCSSASGFELARAMATGPKLLLLDEIAGGSDRRRMRSR
jgi:branched-chain amino acid transport system ATP-binding protein